MRGDAYTYAGTMTTTYTCFVSVDHTRTTGTRAEKKQEFSISGVGMVTDNFGMFLHGAHKKKERKSMP